MAHSGLHGLKRRTAPGLLVATALGAAGHGAALAQANGGDLPPTAQQEGKGDMSTNPFSDRLTGDWGGARASLAGRGIRFDLDSSHYSHGLLSGTGDGSWEYGGRADLYANLSTEGIGLWRGGLVRVHTEYRYGDLAASQGGTLLPDSTAQAFPANANKLIASSVHLLQTMGDTGVLMLGKINTLDLLDSHVFFGGGGYKRFSHLAFAAPADGITPAVMFGAVAVVNRQPASWTFMVFDPEDRTEDYLPDDLFDGDVSVSLTGTRGFRIDGRSTTLSGTVAYTTADAADLGNVLLPPQLRGGPRDHSWVASVQFDHFLREDPARPGSGWGVFAKAGRSDGNPNFFQGFVIGGIGGKGVFEARPQDDFGIGWFHYDFSDDLQDALDPLLEFRDEQGIEVFYNWHATPWLQLGANLQYVDPALPGFDNALSAGVRVVFRL